MTTEYKHIFTPITIGGRTLKNRLMQSKCSLLYDTPEQAAEFYIRAAKSGLASVIVGSNLYPSRDLSPGVTDGIASHIKKISMEDPHTRQVFKAMTEEIHQTGALISYSMMGIEPMDVTLSHVEDWDSIPMKGDYFNVRNLPEIPRNRLAQLIDEFVWRARDVYDLGFDMVTFYVCYRASILARSLSPLLNTRTDEYGGATMEERSRLTCEIYRKVKEACPGMLIEVQISGEEEIPGYTADDWIAYCKCCEGLVDIFQVRGYDGSATHVNGYNMEPHMPPNLEYARKFKEAGIKAAISPVGGFNDPDDIERFLANGWTDMVSMARAFIADPDYLHKLENGQREDIIPCVLCNECHGRHHCTVNPAGFAQDTGTAAISKTVAVIGGGIAGIQAALTAAKRGHRVDLYEQSGTLGGQLRFSDYIAFKWPIRNYRDYMIRQLEKSGAGIYLNTKAEPEMIRSKQYDAVICAMGSIAGRIPVKGADMDGVWNAEDVFGHEAGLGQNVVLIGGGMTGRETALYLAECGHHVTMLTRSQAVLFSDLHAQRAEEDRAKQQENFSYIEHTRVLEILPGKVLFEVKKGIPHVLLGFNGGIIPGHIHDVDGRATKVAVFDESRCVIEQAELAYDTLVISGGRKANTQLADAFKDCAPEWYVIGDNTEPGDIRKCTGEGYEAAMKL